MMHTYALPRATRTPVSRAQRLKPKRWHQPIAPVFSCHDPRWPAVQAALADLRLKGRHAVRIVDADCGSGGLLLRAVTHARALGFVAIEGDGIGGTPALIARARLAAAQVTDPAIGLIFACGDLLTSLAEEAGCPADILLWHEPRSGDQADGMAEPVRRAAVTVIGDGPWSALGLEGTGA